MRKSLLFLFFIGFAFCQPKYSAWLIDTPPKIDGDLSEYQGKPFLFLSNISIPQNLWRGPQDAGAMIWLSWDRDNLYIAGDVRDDILSPKGEPWQESIQFSIAPDLEITYSSGQNKLFVFKNGAPFEGAFPFAVKSTNTSYQMELAIPWTLLGITLPKEETPKEGAPSREAEEKDQARTIVPSQGATPVKGEALQGISLKFNAILYDTDMDGYRGYLSWAPVREWKEGMGLVRDSSQFGDVLLSTQPTPSLQTTLFFAPSPLYLGDEEVNVPLWLMSNCDIKGRLKFTLKKDNETLMEREEDIEKPAGFSSLAVHWDARGKQEGTYIAQATLSIGDMNITLEAASPINKLDVQKLITSLQEEMRIMGQAIGNLQRLKNWRDAVLILQGNAWQAQASSFLELLNAKIKETTQPDPDVQALARSFLWNSREEVAMYRANSALIRGEFQSPALQPFPTLKLPASKELSYLWNWERWKEGGSSERLSLFYANLPIGSVTLWTHPNSQLLSLQRDSLIANWRRNSLSLEQVGSANWQGWITVSPQGGAQAVAQQGNNLWLAEALSRDACLLLLNSAIGGQGIARIDNLLPPLQQDILVEDIGKVVGFAFSEAGFFAAKDDKESLALAQALVDKLGGKLVRLEEVNRYKDVVIVGSTALHQLISGFKYPVPERTAYILTRYLWGKNLLILVGKEPGGTRLAVDVLQDLIDCVRDKRMLVGDAQAFSNLSSGKLNPLQLCLSAMGAFCDFLSIADKGTREGARDALWLSAGKGWELTVIPGETILLPQGGEVVSLGAFESIPASQQVSQLVEAIHKAGGLVIGGEGSEGALCDAWLIGRGEDVKGGKPSVAGTAGNFSLPLRTIVFSQGKGIYEILTAVKRGDCLSFSPYQRLGNEKINRVVNILMDERVYLLRMFGERVIRKADVFLRG